MLLIDLKHGDCLEVMKDIPDGSVDLVVMDPPYNIKKDKEWDSFKKDDYIEFMGEVFKECNRTLADNGQMYFFHNNILTISALVTWLQENTGFVMSSFLVLPKRGFRNQVWTSPGEKSNLRSWFDICEYALHYINGKSLHTEWDKTGWDRVRLDVSNFETLRKYAYNMLVFIGNNSQNRAGKSYSAKQIERDLGHRRAEHFFYCYPRKKDGL